MTIYQIKEATLQTSPYFFSPKTLKFFGQTMGKFKTHKQPDGRIKISCPMVDRNTGKQIGETVRFFNPENNKLEFN